MLQSLTLSPDVYVKAEHTELNVLREMKEDIVRWKRMHLFDDTWTLQPRSVLLIPQLPYLKCLAMQVKAEHTELEELREMKEDIVRRERAQAAIIDNQAKRLDELDSLYKVLA